VIDTDKYEGHTCAYCEEAIEGEATMTIYGTPYHSYCVEKLIVMKHHDYDGLDEDDIEYWGD